MTISQPGFAAWRKSSNWWRATSPVKGNLAETIQRRFAAFGGLEFELPRRDAMRQAPGFDE